ncbi:integrase [Exiguobacterium sp. SH5S4]|uniref:site-specific tyrosine recombinase/integron integrase n=1 Tax=Exiguobacterium sp. SH5S4 TaxID=2510961 RepID=UPI00103C5B63|nr:site-specific tyrosine recombinase/integron integrase [Exiguobacterium sp. SH5S4]TCI26759.1 integrase [Exiguobacterium sp. SH5S4]
MQTANEQIVTELTSYITRLTSATPVDVDGTKNELSKIVSKYNVTAVSLTEVHPDLNQKIFLFESAKKLEGLSFLTLNTYARDLRVFAEDVKKRTDEISTADIRSHLSKFSHLKMSSLGRKQSVLKSFFGWLTSEEYILRDPSKKLKSPKKEKRLPKALSIEELEMLREGCKTNRQRVFLEVLYATGCRLSEIQQLNRRDINFQDKSCKVVGKGDKEREVYFSYKAMYHLEKYLKSRTDDNEALMVSERKPHGRLSKRGIQREISVIAKQSSVKKHVSPHSLRHTFATTMLNAGADITGVQALLGHASVSTTQIYCQLTEEKKREQHRKFLVQ